MSPERDTFDRIWNKQRIENRVNNLALADGVFVDGIFRRGVTARVLFRKLISKNGTDQTLQD